jgi:hypothetical protein
MRLWTLHPRYLDAIGLVSVWRKALLARQVLRGKTTAYRTHPQLERFRAHASPISAINAYLRAVFDEASERGYSFDRSKLGRVRDAHLLARSIPTTDGQIALEWKHLAAKLKERGTTAPASQKRAKRPKRIAAHPLFRVKKGGVESWERV